MLGDGGLAFREFAVKEDLPLAVIHEAVLEFLRGRDDAALFGAQAVNAYVDEPRMTQDVDILSVRADALSADLRQDLADRFHIAVRRREPGRGAYRLFQIREPKNRHLVDVRQIDVMPPTQTIAGVRVLAPAELVAEKVVAWHRRRGRPKAGTDWRDLASLLLMFPDLKVSAGAVRAALDARQVDPATIAAWDSLVREPIVAEEDDY